MRKGFVVCGALFLALILAGHGGEGLTGPEQRGAQPQPMTKPGTALSSSMKVDTDFGKMPLYFIANRGQMDGRVAYYVQGRDKAIYFTSEGLTLALNRIVEKDEASRFPEGGGGAPGSEHKEIGLRNSVEARPTEDCRVERWVVKLDFVGANPGVKPIGEDETGAIVSYFKGNKEDWKTGLPTYSKVVYRDLWPGIDLVYSGTVNKLKYEFIVHPGAEPSKIRMAYRGVESISIDEAGRLQVTTPGGSFSDDVPVAYQEVEGRKRAVSLSYRLLSDSETEGIGWSANSEMVGDASVSNGTIENGDHADGCGQDLGRNDFASADKEARQFVYGFNVGNYDLSLPLVLDPALLVYCGYIGGSSNDYGRGIAVDGSGNAYVTGYTWSTEATFPETVGPDLTYNGGDSDAFVAKVNASGTGLVYCGYIGGSSIDEGTSIAVDGSGNAYVTGTTYSTQATFPVAVGPDLTYNGNTDAFVARINSSGLALAYCGYIGGSSDDFGFGIAVDGSGNAYVTGYTGSTEATFPEAVGPDVTFNGDWDAFVAKVNASGTGLVYCGYIGGSSVDEGNSIAVDGSGNAYVTGTTYSTQATFPVAVGPDMTHNGSSDAFVAKVNASGTALVSCGYIGGSNPDYGRCIAVDWSGNAYITGETYSTEDTFPVAVGPDLTYNGNLDAFVAKVNASGTALVYCGYIGGSDTDYGQGIAVDKSGNVYVAGGTLSAEATFPASVGPDLTFNGACDVFVAKVYYFEQPVHKHAVGDFDGDGTDEAAVDFGTSGIWMWNGGTWSQLSTNNPENMVPFDIDGNGDDEIAVDLGSLGLWMWNGGVWSQFTASNPEYLIAVDTNNNGIEELIVDFGGAGLKRRQESGTWSGMSGYDAQNIMAADVDNNGNDDVVADFGTIGMWLWISGSGWSQLSASDPIVMDGVDAYGFGNEGIAAGLGSVGTWLWDGGLWSQLSGLSADGLVSGRMMIGGGEEIAGDFGVIGLWMWSSSVWTQLSGVNAEDMITADVDGNGMDEAVVDFGLLGLWLWNSGSWTQLSGVNPEGLLAGELDGDSARELVVDFGSLGVWMWNGGTWTQISALNPD